jgi:hypothetical protein
MATQHYYCTVSISYLLSRALQFLLVDAMSLSCVEVYLSLSANTKWTYSLVTIPHVVVKLASTTSCKHNFLQAPGRKISGLIASQLTLTVRLQIWRSNCSNRTRFISCNRKIAFDTTETICYNPWHFAETEWNTTRLMCRRMCVLNGFNAGMGLYALCHFYVSH